MALRNALGDITLEQTQQTVLERLEHIVLALDQLLGGAGAQLHDGLGRTRVSIDTPIATVTTVNTVAAVTRLNQLASVPVDAVPYQLANGSAATLRDRIVVS